MNLFLNDNHYGRYINNYGSSYEQQVYDMVNAERTAYGLKPLQLSRELSQIARIKSADIRDRGYFGHDSPTYGSPFDMLKKFGLDYHSAGENIAKGQKTPTSVMRSWMSSEGHRENILNTNFNKIGIGFVSDTTGVSYWTQLFIAN